MACTLTVLQVFIKYIFMYIDTRQIFQNKKILSCIGGKYMVVTELGEKALFPFQGDRYLLSYIFSCIFPYTFSYTFSYIFSYIFSFIFSLFKVIDISFPIYVVTESAIREEEKRAKWILMVAHSHFQTP